MAARRIDDHSFWAGSPEKGGVLPAGSKMKAIEKSEGDGGIRDYPDTEAQIHRDQKAGVGKIKSHPQKAGYRN
jgi:hypothetical protein